MMKRNRISLKLLILAGLLAVFAGASPDTSRAQARNHRAGSVHVRVIKKLPKGRLALRVDGRRFYFHNGVFYGKRTGGFVVVSAPMGAVVKRLPKRRHVVHINRTRYFVVDGVYYVRVKKGFRVARPPVGALTYGAGGYQAPSATYGVPGWFFSTSFQYAYVGRKGGYAFVARPYFGGGFYRAYAGNRFGKSRLAFRSRRFGEARWENEKWDDDDVRFGNDDRFEQPRGETGRSVNERKRNRSRRRSD